MQAAVNLAGRALLSVIFLLAGFDKIRGYEATAGYMRQFGVPAELLPAAIALEILGGVAIALGFYSRYAALALAAFTLVTAFIFHRDFSNDVQLAMFLKNLAIAGGLLVLAADGPGHWAIGDR